MKRPSFIFVLLFVIYIPFNPASADFGGFNRNFNLIGGCKNTVSGPWYMTDDQGRVCERDSFDYKTGCCRPGSQQYDCDSCHVDDSCCSNYERCVSCCMAPQNEPATRMLEVSRGFEKKESGQWADPFDYCRAVCRTTSRSTQHENAFIDARRFCFISGARPKLAAPPAPPLPPTITIVAGEPGGTCLAACRKNGMKCSRAHFAAINDCNTLRDTFMCEAGCGVPEYATKEYPGYVKENAEKHSWPAFCFVLYDTDKAAAGVAPRFSCAASDDDVERLCPCQEVLDGDGGDDASGGGDSSKNEEVVQGEDEDDDERDGSGGGDSSKNEEVVQGEDKDDDDETEEYVFHYNGAGKEEEEEEEEEEEKVAVREKRGSSKDEKENTVLEDDAKEEAKRKEKRVGKE